MNVQRGKKQNKKTLQNQIKNARENVRRSQEQLDQGRHLGNCFYSVRAIIISTT